jgi:hypothetical protein
MKNQFNKEHTVQTGRRPRIRSVVYRRAIERLEEALERAVDVKSQRLCQLEHMQQIEAIEDVRRRLFGAGYTREAKRGGRD